MEIKTEERAVQGESITTTTTSSTTTTNTSPGTGAPSDYVIEGMTLYEMYRKERHPITDESTTSIPIRILNKDLTCPICLNIIHNTLTVMQCLHRFCNACILKSLRMGKKECPTCRIACSSRRNLRPDPNFDGLIKVLYPNLEKYEQQEETMIQQINNEYVAKVVAASVEEGMKRQKKQSKKRDKLWSPSEGIVNRERRERKKEKDPKTKKQKTDHSIATNVQTLSPAAPPRVPPPLPPAEVNIAVAPHPQEATLSTLVRPFLRIPAAAAVKHVVRFLALKFPNVDPSSIKVVLGQGISDAVKFAKGEKPEDNGGLVVQVDDFKSLQPLSEDIALPVLREMWNRRDEILLLYYTDNGSGANNGTSSNHNNNHNSISNNNNNNGVHHDNNNDNHNEDKIM